jgi:hypothetical protein
MFCFVIIFNYIKRKNHFELRLNEKEIGATNIASQRRIHAPWAWTKTTTARTMLTHHQYHSLTLTRLMVWSFCQVLVTKSFLPLLPLSQLLPSLSTSETDLVVLGFWPLW